MLFIITVGWLLLDSTVLPCRSMMLARNGPVWAVLAGLTTDEMVTVLMLLVVALTERRTEWVVVP